MTNLSDIVGSSNVLTTNNTKTVTNKTISGSSNTLTNLPAANLTGTLPAIDGSNLTGISAGLDSAAVSAIITADVDNSFVDALNADADTLDGVNSTSFLRSDTSDNFTSGSIEFNDNTQLRFGSSADTIIEHSTSGTDGTIFYANTTNGNMRFQDGSTTVFDIARTAANTTTFFQTVDFTNATVTGLSTGGGGSGSGIEGGVFLEYEKTVDSDYTIDSDGNGRGIYVLSAADDSDGLTIATGATVTVNSGSSWVLSGGDKNMGLDAMVATSNQTERTMRTGTIKPTLDETYDIGDSAVVYNIGHFRRVGLKPITTTVRDALSGIGNGDLVYNSTTNKFQGYANGSWVDLH